MKVSTVLTALFATVLPQLASAIIPEHENHPRDFERRQAKDYCLAEAGFACQAPDAPCCTDSQHGAYCQDGKWFVYQANSGCEILSGTEVVANLS